MNDIGTLLRENDPAKNAQLDVRDRHRIRAAMFAAHGEPRRAPFLRAVAAMLMSLAVLFTVTFTLVRPRQAPQPRRVEYVTPGGTRVIWMLER